MTPHSRYEAIESSLFYHTLPLRGEISKMITGNLSEPMWTILYPAAVRFFCSIAPGSIDMIALVLGLDIVWKYIVWSGAMQKGGRYKRVTRCLVIKRAI